MTLTNEELWEEARRLALCEFDNAHQTLTSIRRLDEANEGVTPTNGSRNDTQLALIRKKLKYARLISDMKRAEDDGKDYLVWKLSKD